MHQHSQSSSDTPNILMPLRRIENWPRMTGEQALAVLLHPEGRRQSLASDQPGELEYHALRSLPRDPDHQLGVAICLTRLIADRREEPGTRRTAAETLIQRLPNEGKAVLLALDNLNREAIAVSGIDSDPLIHAIANEVFGLEQQPGTAITSLSEIIERALNHSDREEQELAIVELIAEHSPHRANALPFVLALLSVRSQSPLTRALSVEALRGRYPRDASHLLVERPAA